MNQKYERPDYVKNYEKEKNTEIKYISGKWYLYNRISVWDPIDKKRTKKSGSIIGKITPEGLVPSKHRKRTPEEHWLPAASDEQEVTCSAPVETDTIEDKKAAAALAEAERHAAQLSTINALCTTDGLAGLEVTSEAPGYVVQKKESVVSDVVEAGVIVYLIKRTERLRLILRTVFPENWVYIYIMAMLRAIHVCPLRELQREFHHSMLCYMYPKASLSKQNVSNIIYTLGSQRNKIIEFMRLEMDKSQQYLIIDGHRMLTSASNMPLKALGFDTKARHHDQLNVLYVFSSNCDGTIGSPSFYKQFAGYTIDSVGLKTVLAELKVAEGQIAIGDKGTGSKDRFEQMSHLGLRYIVPLKRNNTEIKGLNLGLASAYPGRFMYKNKLIKYIALDKTDYRVIVYLDQFRRAVEAATEGRKFEKENNKELEKSIKSVNDINKEIAKRVKEKEKTEKDIEKSEKRYQKAVDEMNLADIKLQKKQAAVDATQLKLDNAKQKLDDRISGNAKPEKISEAQHSVDFQESSLTNRKIEATHAAYVLMTKKNIESDALAKVNDLKEKLQKINRDIDNLKNDIVVLERYRNTCQGAVDHGLPMYPEIRIIGSYG